MLFIKQKLTSSNRSKANDRLETLAEVAKSSSTELIRLRKQIRELQCGVPVTSISLDVQELLRSILEAPQRAIAEHHILQALAFNKMRSRFDNVSEAYYKSLHWMLEDKLCADSAHRPIKVLFMNWLGNAEGLFHIAGQLGSGKSILMKFLCEHSCIIELLNEWAGIDRKLAFVQFFF
ncbi:hypothetical protein AOQ84DRAFT_375861 [Glonium stellatum]|uniref:Uncharacterized protein n=1 Tax=Glonium stellatum TaxID=574774 RepID=A0A8E2F351_9PEZI|nr:hypothetical protein AOQ84DRAFT_375861 [Glonium stellatum]